MKALAVGILMAGALLVGCGGGDGDDDSSSQVAGISGTWTGVATSSVGAGSLNITVTLSQQGTNVTGTFTCSPGSGTCLHATGSVSGTVSGNSVTLAIVFPDTHSCGAFNATISGDSMNGNYSCTDPLGNDTGAWSVTR